MKKVIMMLVFFVITSFAVDYGVINVDPSINKLCAKTNGNTFGIDFNACIYVPIIEDGVTYYYYIIDGDDKYLASSLMMKYSMQTPYQLRWSRTITASNGKQFRRIVMVL